MRYGCHSAHLLIKRLVKVPPFLEQLQGLLLTLFPRLSLPGVVRVRLGIENCAQDVDTLICVLEQIARQPRAAAKSGVRQQMDAYAETAAQRVYSPLR